MLRKKIIVFILTLSLFLPCLIFDTYALSASSAAVMLSDTGEMLFEKNAHKKMSMASTTKIMTALIACESGKLNETVTVSKMMTAVEGTSMGLRSGDRLTLSNIVRGMMLLSGNDAANAVAIFLSGSLDGFAREMNRQAQKIGMKNTHFVTPSGLDDDEHYTTAYDMALLASYAIKNPLFCEFVSSYSGKVEYIYPKQSFTYRNHNRFLKMYDGACGIKTGFTKKSGRCLVTSVEHNKMNIVAVTLNAPDDWNDHIFLYDECIAKIKKHTVDGNFSRIIRVFGGDKACIAASVKGNISIFSAKNDIKTEILTEKIIYPPIEKGDIVGYVRVYDDSRIIEDFPLTADENVYPAQPLKMKNKIIIKFRELFGRFKKWLTAA